MQTVDIELLRSAVAITMTTRAWGNRRKASLAAVTTQADKRLLSLSKQLIRSPEYDAVRRHLAGVRFTLGHRTVPSYFRSGLQLCRLSQVEPVEAELRAAVETLRGKVDAFKAAYPEQVTAAQESLQDQFNPNDYPSAAQVAGAFGIEWNWIAFTVPEGLPAELRKTEADKLQKQFKDAGDQIIMAIRGGFADIINHAVERLKTEPGGQPKIFRDSLVTNIRFFIETFADRNLMNDDELSALVDRAKMIVGDVNPQTLRESDQAREHIVAKLAEVKASLDTMIEERKSRVFDFGEEVAA